MATAVTTSSCDADDVLRHYRAYHYVGQRVGSANAADFYQAHRVHIAYVWRGLANPAAARLKAKLAELGID